MADNKIRILFLAANPKETDLLNFREELTAIQDELGRFGFKDSFDLEIRLTTKRRELSAFLLHYKPHIVHFSAHGTKYGEIILEGEGGRARPLSPTALRDFFQALGQEDADSIPRLVVMNACYSTGQASALAEVIDCVVGMSRDVGDDDAIAFSAGFYQALGFGRSVQNALEIGKASISMENLPDSAVPRLVSRTGVKASIIRFAQRVDGKSIDTPLDGLQPVPEKTRQSMRIYSPIPSDGSKIPNEAPTRRSSGQKTRIPYAVGVADAPTRLRKPSSAHLPSPNFAEYSSSRLPPVGSFGVMPKPKKSTVLIIPPLPDQFFLKVSLMVIVALLRGAYRQPQDINILVPPTTPTWEFKLTINPTFESLTSTK
jgi:CHAT domain